MRVRHFRPDDEGETSEYLTTLARIDEFWKEFRIAAARWRAGDVGKWLGVLRASLARVEPGLGLELVSELDGNRQLYVLAATRPSLAPLARWVVERAPLTELWTFDVHRPPQSLEQSLEITRKDCGLDLRGASARVGVGRGHAVEIVIASEHFSGAGDEVGLDAACCLLSRLLGDERYEDWVADVSITTQRRSGPLALVGEQSGRLPLQLSELEAAVERAVLGIRAALPEHPCHVDCERAEWTMFELGELELPEPEALVSPDLFVATSMRPEMLRTHLSGAHFSSQRFSRHREQFCVLRYEASEPDLDERARRRVELEMAIDRALVPGRLGAVVGSGIGTQYVYVYLALAQLDAALELLRRRARAFELAPGAQIRFCDSALADEWVTL